MTLIKKLGVYLLVALTLYIFVISIHFVWRFVEPEGFWDFWYFTELIRLWVVIVLNLITFLFLTYAVIKEPVKWYLPIVFLLISVVSYTFILGPGIIFLKSVSSITKHKERVDEFIQEGYYLKAKDYAETVYDQGKDRFESPHPFFAFSYWHYNSESIIQERNVQLFNALINYSYTLHSLGINFETAKELIVEAKQIDSKLLPNSPLYKLLPTQYLLNLYIEENNHKKIRETLVQIKRLQSENENSLFKVTSLLTIAKYYQKFGDVNKALSLRNEAIDLFNSSDFTSSNGIKSQILLIEIMNLLADGDISTASEKLSDLKILIEDFEDDYIYIDFLKVQSYLSYQNQDFTKALDLVEEVLEELKDRDLENTLLFSDQLFFAAKMYVAANDIRSANEKMQKALKISKDFNWVNKKDYLEKMVLAQSVNMISNDSYPIGEDFLELNQSVIEYLNENLIFLSQREREHFVSFGTDQIGLLNSMLIKNPGSHSELLLNNILGLNKLTYHSINYFNEAFANDTILSIAYNDIVKKRRELDQLIINKADKDNVQEFRFELNLSEKALLEKLNNSSSRNFAIDGFAWTDIRRNLTPGEGFIHFTEIQDNIFEENTNCYAFIVTSEMSQPAIISLGKRSTIDEVLSTNEGLTIDRVNSIYSADGFLYNKLWSPLKPYLSNLDHMYISKSGVVNFISFSALGIEEENSIEYLSSVKELQNVKDSNPRDIARSVLYGGVNFNKSNINLSKSRSAIYKNLPFTVDEINAIDSLMDSKNLDATIYKGLNATETSFKNLEDKKPQTIHLATHGYYFDRDEDYRVFELLGDESNYDNPMLRSGLLFANYGYNNAADDGVLTAEEISRMNLSSTELIVLSACESALGDSRGEEGIFGLQRALKIAGVKNIVMSLWKVPDKETAILMEYFYEKYLEGTTVQKSLEFAQKQVKKEYPNPFYWAGFIAVR
jgi:hypothetical protein